MRDELSVAIKHVTEDPVKVSDIQKTHEDTVTANRGVVIYEGPVSPIQPRQRMILNPDREVVDRIISRIFKCEGKCPCQPQDSTEDTRCPCGDFTGRGVCHCKLFIPDKED